MQQQAQDTAQQQQQQPQQQQPNANKEIVRNGNNVAPNSPGSAAGTVSAGRAQISGGRFDFEDGGTYCGGWEEGKAHGHGVCTGPKHQGAYSGAWNYGFEVSGVYIWSGISSSFEGQWQNGRRHGLGVETRGRWVYRGEFTSGSKGRYGVRHSTTSSAKYEGTWASGLQDGYGSETYADGGSYQGQWQEGKRHGYGVRTSAPFGLASHYRPKTIQTSMTSLRSNDGNADPAEKRNHRIDDVRGGFVLKASSDEPPARRNSLVEKTRKGLLSGLKLKKQRSTGDLEKRGTASGSIRSTVSTASWISTGSSQSAISNKTHTDSNASFTVDEEHLDPSVTEVYMGEWKRDKRDGYGISERSDGLKYEGEWHNNKKHGYGVTTFRDGTKEEGKYKYNVLITSQKKKHLFLIRSAKFRERIEAGVSSAQRASKYALQKADIAVSRTATARGKGEMADAVADHAKIDSEVAVATAREFAPDFKPSVLERLERIRVRDRFRAPSAEPGPTSTSNYAHQKPPLLHAATIGGSPSHPMHSGGDQRTQVSVDSTPQKQQTFPQGSIRRTSLLQKQASVDYATLPSASGHGPMPLSSSSSSQHQQQQYPHQMTGNQTQNYNSTMPQHQLYDHQQQQQQHQYPQPQYSHYDQSMPNQNYSQSMGQHNSQYGNSNSGGGGGSGYYGGPQQQQQQQLLQQQQQQQHQQQNYSSPMSQQNYVGGGVYSNQQMPQNQLNQSYPNYNVGNQQQQLDQSYNQSPLQQQQQQQQQKMYDGIDDSGQNQADGPGPANLRRNSRPVNDSGRPPHLGSFKQSSIDHYDHYKRPPSRDSSVDRYARAASRLGGSRQASIDRTIGPINPSTSDTMSDRNARAGSAFRNITPSATPTQAATASALTGNGSVLTGIGASPRRVSTATPIRGGGGGGGASQAHYSSPNQPFEDVLLRQRTLGQDIIPSPREPKRTESLYLPPKPMPTGAAASAAKGKLKSVPIALPLSRKKSLPDVQELPRATGPMSREEVSALGSARREEIRRQIELSERLKANPLLYLVSPQVKDWFSRQQLVVLVLVVNVILAILFFRMLT